SMSGINSASGPDGMTAKALKSFSPSVWTCLFNKVLPLKLIPNQWRHISATFLDKGNDKPRDSPSRWRPLFIAAQALRLLSAILANKFSRWISHNTEINVYQVGFFPLQGTLLNVYKTRTRLFKGDVACSIDLTDAFGSVDHSLLRTVIDDYTTGNFNSFLHGI
ncbi:hypothetical protein ADUPG1_004696, partial [Aduncisulcus paluster]